MKIKEIKKEIIIPKFVARIDDVTEEYLDSYTEAIEKIKEWFYIDLEKEECCGGIALDQLRRYAKPVIAGRILSWEEFDELYEIDGYNLQFAKGFNGYQTDDMHAYIEDRTEKYYVELDIESVDDYKVEGTWSIYRDQEYRTYFDLNNISEGDVEDIIQKALVDSKIYVNVTYAFDEYESYIDPCSTARGKFTAYKK